MPRSYEEELVIAESEDGIVMQGAVIRPSGDGGRTPETVTSTTAVVWVHGLTSTFYSMAALGVGRALAEAGITLITGNNRGHDFGALVRTRAGEFFLAGAGWERFDESPRDVAGWLNVAEQRGFGRIVLLGHSLGALKAIYYQTRRQDPRVAALIACSPPIKPDTGPSDPGIYTLAQRMVAEGRGRDLLPWEDGPPGFATVSAHTLVNRIEHNFRGFVLEGDRPAIAELRCPLLAIYGTEEAAIGGEEQLAQIRKLATAADSVTTHLIDGADHVYTGREQAVAHVIAAWLNDLR
jgi:pimeloyl-ACP methyl ester carboxylesterase